MTRATPQPRQRHRNQRAPPVQHIKIPQPANQANVIQQDEHNAARSSSASHSNDTLRAMRDAERCGDTTTLAVAWAEHAVQVAASSMPDMSAMCKTFGDSSCDWFIELNLDDSSDSEGEDFAQTEGPSMVIRCHSHCCFNASGLRALPVARMTTAMPLRCGRTLRSNTAAMRIRRSHLHPTPDPRYVSAGRNCRWQIMRSIDENVAPREVVAKYNRIFGRTPRTEVKEGLVVMGLFVKDPVRLGCIVSEYTRKRVCSSDFDTLKAAMYYYGVSSNTLITIPSDRSVIDPRECGGDGRYVNNSCKTNCEIHQVDVGGGCVVAALSALVDLPHGMPHQVQVENHR